MKTTEIKKRLIDEITSLDNRELLEELYRFLNLEKKIEKVYKLNEEQESAVAEAREQIRNGDYLTNDDANDEIDKWLEE